jgi:hypothetical protein
MLGRDLFPGRIGGIENRICRRDANFVLPLVFAIHPKSLFIDRQQQRRAAFIPQLPGRTARAEPNFAGYRPRLYPVLNLPIRTKMFDLIGPRVSLLQWKVFPQIDFLFLRACSRRKDEQC